MSQRSKIYTKTGDLGQTSLIGGKRVPKFHQRIETYGTIDELNSFIGLIRDHDIDNHVRQFLLEVQDRLFTLESQIAKDPESVSPVPLPMINEYDIELLEREIDMMDETLPELKTFILPGGHPVVSYCHIARCVCRRAERHAIRLAQDQSVDPINIKYLNRLSDYLFVLSRKLGKDFNIHENPWKART